MDQDKIPTLKNEQASKIEIFAWAMYDFANSAYTTIVSTTVFNPYFVEVVAGKSSNIPAGIGTLLLTISLCISSLAVVLSAPIIGTIADLRACKKKILFWVTISCVICTSFLSQVGPGEYVLGMFLLTLANLAYGTAEDLVAAFLPEISSKENMGKISAFGWSIGYLGGLTTLGLCYLYVSWAKSKGQVQVEYVPVTMLITALFYLLGALPIFIFLKERAKPLSQFEGQNYFRLGLERLKMTVKHAYHYKDLIRFLASLLVYSCGTSTVIGLASVYAQQVMGFSTSDCLVMIFVVNITAALGAFTIGFIQDKIGSVLTLIISLFIWILACLGAFFCTSKEMFWLIANLIGVAIGTSGSAGRALVGLFSPPGRSGEFFGLWGLASKLAAAIGPLTFGIVASLTNNNHRLALLSSALFFIFGLFVLFTVNEDRGKQAARDDI